MSTPNTTDTLNAALVDIARAGAGQPTLAWEFTFIKIEARTHVLSGVPSGVLSLDDYQVAVAGLPGTWSRAGLANSLPEIAKEADEAALASVAGDNEDRAIERDYAKRSR